MNLEIDNYLAERVVNATLLESISDCYDEVHELAYKDSLQKHEYQDLKDSMECIIALMEVYTYYNADTSVLDQYQPDADLILRVLGHA